MGWRTVRPRWADGPPLLLRFVPERVSLWWASKLNCGQSAHGRADGPLANLSFVPERLFLWFGLKSELRMVRPWGADGPQANSNLYQRACLSLVSQIS